LPTLLACWTRSGMLARAIGKRAWPAGTQKRYAALVRQAARLARPDGSLAGADPALADPSLLRAAAKVADDQAASVALGKRLRPRQKASRKWPASPLPPAASSEWSDVSVLAAGWKPKAPQITVACDGSHLSIELASRGRVVLAGDWPVLGTIDSKPFSVAGPWERQCWFSDEHCDYLELSIQLSGGGRLERQVFLARHDRVGFLAEAWLGGSSAARRVEQQMSLPLAAGASFSPEAETRDGWLVAGKKPTAGVVPLALPEWRAERRVGELLSTGGRLELTQQAVGRNAHQPLMLDFRPSRFARQRTWRKLAVAQQLKNVPPDVAAGYRMQSGDDQWLVYRSLAAAANRTVLGGNFACETVIGRFLPTGEIEEYCHVDAESRQAPHTA
ncbi:MAG: hypothetical protein AAF790_02950, partial [Planctomycetota bacterium]